MDITYESDTCTLTLSIQPAQGKGIHATVFARPDHLSGLIAGLAASADVLNEIRKMEES